MHWWIHEYIWAQEESLAAKLKAQELADTKSSILSKQVSKFCKVLCRGKLW